MSLRLSKAGVLAPRLASKVVVDFHLVVCLLLVVIIRSVGVDLSSCIKMLVERLED